MLKWPYPQDRVPESKAQEVSNSLLTRKDIKIKTYVSPSQALDELVRQLQELVLVDMVQVDSPWLQRLAAISNLASIIGSVLSVIVILRLFFVVGNTIELAIENRKAAIKVVELVGGSDM